MGCQRKLSGKPEKEGRGIRWVRVGVGKVAEMIAVQICGWQYITMYVTMYIRYNVRSVCLDLRLTSKGGAGCFLSSPAAADDPPTCICIHPGGTHVNTNTSWWQTCKYNYILVAHIHKNTSWWPALSVYLWCHVIHDTTNTRCWNSTWRHIWTN